MKFVARAVVVLLVLALLVVGAALLADRYVEAQVEAVAEAAITRELRAVTDAGGEFTSVQAEVKGNALLGLATDSLDVVRVVALDGVIRGVPVQRVDLEARGVSRNGRMVDSLAVTVHADAARGLAAQLAPELAQSVRDSAVAMPPDTLRFSAPVPIPLIEDPLVQIDVVVRVQDGGLVVEPTRASAVGLDVDLSRVPVLPSYGIAAEELPAGLRLDSAEVLEGADGPVVVAELSCSTGCALNG